MNNIENLGTRRADKSGDCRSWTPLDAARSLVKDIESGELKPDMIYVAMTEPLGDGKHSYRFIAAGGDMIQFKGMLFNHLTDKTCLGV